VRTQKQRHVAVPTVHSAGTRLVKAIVQAGFCKQDGNASDCHTVRKELTKSTEFQQWKLHGTRINIALVLALFSRSQAGCFRRHKLCGDNNVGEILQRDGNVKHERHHLVKRY
jgi:hypothetical protein